MANDIDSDKQAIMKQSIIGLHTIVMMNEEPPHVIHAMEEYLKQLLDLQAEPGEGSN